MRDLAMIYTTRRLIAAIMEKYDIESKYALAKLMDVNWQTAKNWLDHDRTFDDKSAKKAAELLELDYEYILVCMQYDRAKKDPETKRAWEHVAKAWEQSKAAIFAIIITSPFLPLTEVITSI